MLRSRPERSEGTHRTTDGDGCNSKFSISSAFLVFCLINKLVFFDPWHHIAQLCPDHFNLMGGCEPATGFKHGCAGTILKNKFTSVRAYLDFMQNLAHFCPGGIGDNAWTSRNISIFSVI